MAYRGKYKPRCPYKYKGDPTKIIYRSLWELKFMRYCDSNMNILEWGSEEIALPYRSPVDNKASNSALLKLLLISFDLLIRSFVIPLIADEITTTLFFFLL